MPRSRKKSNRPLRQVFHIYCEGEKTEPNYLSGYLKKRWPGKRTLEVIRIEPTKKNTPAQLVDEAVKKKNDRETPPGDVFWVVYDRESPTKYKRSIHAKARDKAQKNGVEIALSNVCFEVWLLLHFDKHVGHFDCYLDLRKQSLLTKHIPNYDKGSKDYFEVLGPRVDDARQNASRVNENTKNGANPEHTAPHDWNPYTNVHELLDAIDEFAENLSKS